MGVSGMAGRMSVVWLLGRSCIATVILRRHLQSCGVAQGKLRGTAQNSRVDRACCSASKPTNNKTKFRPNHERSVHGKTNTIGNYLQLPAARLA